MPRNFTGPNYFLKSGLHCENVHRGCCSDYKGGCLLSSVVGGIYEENASYKWKIVVLPFKNMADEEVRKCFN